ncbi:hypothetical protein HAX54_042085, partial [Datura stramonium]|nr:hypothetical protein [Datura stramonium]
VTSRKLLLRSTQEGGVLKVKILALPRRRLASGAKQRRFDFFHFHTDSTWKRGHHVSGCLGIKRAISQIPIPPVMAGGAVSCIYSIILSYLHMLYNFVKFTAQQIGSF